MGEIVYICETCGERLDERREEVTEAATLLPAGNGDVVEGPHVFYHPAHYPPGGRRHRLVARRTTIDEALRRLGDR